jgi:hypothetical protein
VAGTGIEASLIVCESLLWEKSGLPSAIRIMDTLVIGASGIAHFFSLTNLYAAMPVDDSLHALVVQAMDPQGRIIAAGAPYAFKWSYGPDQSFAGFRLATEFNLDFNTPLGSYVVQAFVDGEPVAGIPLTLRRRQ